MNNVTTRHSFWTLYRRLFRIAAPSPLRFIVIVALTVVTSLIVVALPWPLQYLVDNVFSSAAPSDHAAHLYAMFGYPSRGTVVVAVAIVGFLLHLVNGLLGVLLTRSTVALGEQCTFRLRTHLFNHYERLSLRTHQLQLRGDQLYRLGTNAQCLEQLTLGGALPLLGSALTLVSVLAILSKLDRELAVLSLAIVPVLVACARYYIGPIETQEERVSEHEGQVLSFAEQVLTGLPIVKAFVREASEARRFRDQAQRAMAARLAVTARQTWFALAMGLITAAGTALVLIIGGLHVVDGTLSTGELLVVLSYLASLYDPLHTISFTVGAMQSAVAGARRVIEVLDMEPERMDEDQSVRSLPTVQGHIVFEHVVFGYGSQMTILNDISFEVPSGSMTALVGPTGAGKTTIARMLLRFNDPQHGHIFIDGYDIGEVPVTSLRRQISVVLQEPILFPSSIAENIRYGKPDATDEEVRAAAVAACADTFINALPEGYDTVLAEDGLSLSGGERQRLSLARAFIKNAPILILDEPTSALDAATESSIMESLQRLMENRTAIVIAHRLSTIRRADQILFIENGAIVERGTHDELRADAGAYARLLQIYRRLMGSDGENPESPPADDMCQSTSTEDSSTPNGSEDAHPRLVNVWKVTR